MAHDIPVTKQMRGRIMADGYLDALVNQRLEGCTYGDEALILAQQKSDQRAQLTHEAAQDRDERRPSWLPTSQVLAKRHNRYSA